MFASDRDFAPIVHALPTWLWSGLQMQGHGKVGRAWHLGFAIVMIVNALWYIVAVRRTASWRRLLPNAQTWLQDALRAVIAELRGRRETMQQAQYNGAQKVAYAGVMLLGALMILTGIPLFFTRPLISFFGGQHVVLPVHIVIATLFLAFIAIHVVQVLRAGLPTLLSMITGTTEIRPARTRRSLAWSGVVLAALVVAFTVVRFTSGPDGVPSYLQWTVEHKDQRTHQSAAQEMKARGSANQRAS